MGLLKKAMKEQAYLKAGVFGFGGSGKSYTAMMLAIALVKEFKINKPIAAIETEDGTDFTLKYAEAEGVELVRIKTRSFSEMLEAAKEAEASCSVLLVDSISHIWRGLLTSKLESLNEARKKKGKWALNQLPMPAIGELNMLWDNKWSDWYRASKIHIIVAGRAGFEWAEEEDDQGNDKLIKVGTKMKAQNEFSYEPAFMLEMIKHRNGDEAGDGWSHKAVVLKDKENVICGKSFIFKPTDGPYKKGGYKTVWNAFAPSIKLLNIGGEHVGVGNQQKPNELFNEETGDSEVKEWAKRKDIALENIKLSLDVVSPGKTDASKIAKAAICEALMGVRTWVEVENLKLPQLEMARANLRILEDAVKQSPPESLDELTQLVKSVCTPMISREGELSLEQDSLPV